jgi:hypothetical protein
MITFSVVIVYMATLLWAIRIIVARVARRTLDFWVGFIAGTIYFIYIPLGLVIVLGRLQAPEDFSATSIPDVFLERNAPQVMVLLGMVAMVLACVSFFPRKFPANVVSKNPGGVALKWYFIEYVAISLLVFFLAGLGDDGAHWYRSKEDFLLNYGLFGVLLVYAIVALRIAVLVFSVRQYFLGELSFSRLIGLLVVTCALDLYLTSNRIFTLLVLVTVFIVMVMERRYGWLLAFLAFTPVLAYFMNIFRWIRSFMHSSGAGGIGEVAAGIAIGVDFATKQSSGVDVVDIVSGITESVNLNVAIGIVTRFGGSIDYLYGETFLKAFVFWVPRSIWPSKPDSIATVVGNLFAPGDSAALVATLYGELFANFGMFSFFLIVPMLILAEKLCAILFRDDMVRMLVSFVLGFMVVRLPLSDMLLVTVVLSLVVYGNRVASRYGKALFGGLRNA